MSKQSMGKTLLRNVIRHTDAHNKVRLGSISVCKIKVEFIMYIKGHMHCDRVSDQRRDFSRSRERASEHDDRETRYWTRKLYEFEANDPDRWGHSGFKELYPEEFESDGSATKKINCHKMKKSKSDTEACLSKRSKKSARKKKKKKKNKGEDRKRKKVDSSSSDCSSDDSGATKDKQRRKRTKSRHKNKKASKSRGKDEDSSTEDSNDEIKRERLSHSRKRRKHDLHKDSDSGANSKKKKRKNWKAVGEESSDSSVD
uniref:NKAP domain containing 1 n=1 Tax=Amphilophus citrinellus TaxID=61819 RepID=A0A3Q0REV3_AMPCI